MSLNPEDDEFWAIIRNAPEELWKDDLQQPPGPTPLYPDSSDTSTRDVNGTASSNVLSYPSPYGIRPGPGHTAFANEQWNAESRGSAALAALNDISYPTNNVMNGNAIHGDRILYYEPPPSTAAGTAPEHRPLQYVLRPQADIQGGIVRPYQHSAYPFSHPRYLTTPQASLEQALSAIRLESPPPPGSSTRRLIRPNEGTAHPRDLSVLRVQPHILSPQEIFATYGGSIRCRLHSIEDANGTVVRNRALPFCRHGRLCGDELGNVDGLVSHLRETHDITPNHARKGDCCCAWQQCGKGLRESSYFRHVLTHCVCWVCPIRDCPESARSVKVFPRHEGLTSHLEQYHPREKYWVANFEVHNQYAYAIFK